MPDHWGADDRHRIGSRCGGREPDHNLQSAARQNHQHSSGEPDVADATSSVSASVSPENKSTGEIRHEMQETRESITEKVAALENQVLGTIQTAADTVTNTVEAVKDVVTAAPHAVSDTVKQTVEAV